MLLRTHVPIIGSGIVPVIIGEITGSADSVTGEVVTGGEGGGGEVQPARTDVRMTRVITRPVRIGFFLHEDILIPLCQDNYQVSCCERIAPENRGIDE